MDKKNIDFLVIGAMRSGTTTLHELLKDHPEISLPPGKEVPFFSDNESYKKGVAWYIENNFKNKGASATLGTITPQYMFTDKVDTSQTARRIYDYSPSMKIVAILRHPIERSYSHYNYAKRHNHDNREFDKAIADILNTKNLKKKQREIGHRFSYLSRSMYGEQLKPYYKYFGKKQILILYTNDLEKYPKKTVLKIYDFIGVSNKYISPQHQQVFHKGGARAKLSFLTPGKIGRFKPVMKLYRLLVPYKLRKRFEIWFHTWNIKEDNSKLDPNSDTYKKLVGYFEKDVKLLEKLTGKKTPWKDWS